MVLTAAMNAPVPTTMPMTMAKLVSFVIGGGGNRSIFDILHLRSFGVIDHLNRALVSTHSKKKISSSYNKLAWCSGVTVLDFRNLLLLLPLVHFLRYFSLLHHGILFIFVVIVIIIILLVSFWLHKELARESTKRKMAYS